MTILLSVTFHKYGIYKNDKGFVIARICKAWACKFVAIHKFSVAFALWIATLALWLARNDGQRKRILSFYNDGAPLSFWVSETSEKSKEFKTHFKFKAKNLCFKYANSHFKFVDTSLRSVWQEIRQYDKFVSMTKTKQQDFKARLKQTPRYLKSKFSQNDKLFK